ncbi:hypothetical protein GIB67_037472 [Kingdonia uniflora]|uniref:Nucleoporin Nup54 alpha-helical domain-containing protein n=1 Tax=Kingdonia uniflora TaxID=39325 RepID=A0A7J7P280_9MAGN|nr:hypothetical protein GIB67_037472 [Kingdonia uniflora]
MFGTPASTPAFGTPSTPSFTPGFGSTLFSSPFSQQPQQQQQQQSPLFPQQQQQQSSTGFGFGFGFGATPQPTSPSPFPNAQLTTQMAPVAPLPFSLADRDIQAIVDAYKDDPGNPKYAFKHLLFSVTDQAARTKPAGISDFTIADHVGRGYGEVEGMETADRERLWPQLVQGFKDLSERLKSTKGYAHGLTGRASHFCRNNGGALRLQDEAIFSDAERLKATQTNVKLLQRHFQADTLPSIQRMRQKEQGLQRRLLRVMRIVEVMEGKGCRVPLMKAEAELAEKLAALTLQLKGSGAELTRRLQNLLAVSRVHANGTGGASAYLPGSTKIHEQSLADMQESCMICSLITVFHL